jgi:crossover junction endodeoxyribonuclease RuvC
MQNKKIVRILGIDPGYERLGVAVIEKDNSKNTLIFSGCIETDKKLPHPQRLLHVAESLEHIIQTYTPEETAVETLFFSSNKKTALSVAEARGVILATSARFKLKTFEYTPAQIKIAVTGHGKSDKGQIMNIIPKLISIKKEIERDDEYDAIAIALTHSASRNSLI